MQEIWKTYKVPITATGIGLVLAFILGVAPLLGNKTTPASQQAATGQITDLTRSLEELQITHAAEVAELKLALSRQAQTISDITNRLTNLDRGVTRTFWRSKQTADLVGTMAGANQRLSNLEAQMNTLNVAVPRISRRVRQLQTASE